MRSKPIALVGGGARSESSASMVGVWRAIELSQILGDQLGAQRWCAAARDRLWFFGGQRRIHGIILGRGGHHI